MLKNYLILAFRNFKRNKLFSFINISGLAIGISASLVIYLIVQHELSFDQFHKDKDRIYRIVSESKDPDNSFKIAGVAAPMDAAIRQEVTGVEQSTQFFISYEQKISISEPGVAKPAEFLHQEGIVYADNNYFQFFNYEWIAGSPLKALDGPFKAVLTESRARGYFPEKNLNNIIGREILLDDSIRVTVGGVVKDMKGPTHFNFTLFISTTTITNTGLTELWAMDQWGATNSNAQIFVKIARDVRPLKIQRQLAAIRKKYIGQWSDSFKDETINHLQPLYDIHFNSDYDAFGQRQASRPTLYGLLAVALLLLLLGCINFINLTTANSSQRAKEIGIRKTMGGGKGELMVQFLSETFLLTSLATVVSIILVPWLISAFRGFIPPGVSFGSLNQGHVWIFLFLLVISITFLAGFYPALVLTRFKPVLVLKNQLHASTSQTRKAWLRKTLTVSQFVIAQFLVIATMVVTKQVGYSLNKELGYKKDGIVSFEIRSFFFNNSSNRFILQKKLNEMPEFEKVSLSGPAPASEYGGSGTESFYTGSKVIHTYVAGCYIDTNYLDLFKMKLVAGRNLRANDSFPECVINEAYAHLLGFNNPADAVGHYFVQNRKTPIVGIVADFHSKSTHVAIKPFSFKYSSTNTFTFHLALRKTSNNGKQWKATMEKVGKLYKKYYPDYEFEYHFFDESIARFYQAEQNISSLLKWAAGLSIFISCLGLLGLVIFITNTRTKEIGVRKILGASISQIVSLLSKDFILLVTLAFLITVPIAWWAMHSWLQDFQYRTTMSWWIFAITGAGMLLIAVLILGIRTIKSAMRNPVESLRIE